MKKKFEIDPLHGAIFKNMLLFALPIMGAWLLQILFSAADTAVIGNFGNEGAIAAIGVSASVLHMLVGGLSSLSAGITVAAGKLIGKGEDKKASELVNAMPLTGFILGAVLSAAAILLSDVILGWVSCPKELMADAGLYFRIYFLGVPFMVTAGFLTAFIHAKGNSLIPFVFSITASAVNIALNLVFVIVFDWNIAGVAAATVISQVLLAGSLILWLSRQAEGSRLEFKKLRAFRGLREVFSIGIPSSLEGIILNISNVVISAAVNRFDAGVIGGNTVAAQIESIMTIAFVGFANASVVFISQNHGKGNYPRVRKVFSTTVLTVFIGAELIGTAIYLASPILTRIFTSDPVYIGAARTRMLYMCLFFGFCGLMNVVSGCVRGLGEAKLPLVISIICSVAFRITWIYTYAASKGTIEAIYVSYPLCWALCAGLDVLAFVFVLKRRERELSERKETEEPKEEQRT